MPSKKNPSPMNYSKLNIAIHWASLLVMIAIFALVWTAPENSEVTADPSLMPTRSLLMGLHISFGLLLLFLTAARILLRFLVKQPALPNDMSGFMKFASRTVLVLILATILVQILMGVGIVNGHGYPVSFFGWFDMPKIFDQNVDNAKAMGEVHKTLWIAIVVLLALHVVGALYHHYVRRDQVLLRMLGRAKK
ncbi:MAG: cytochrome b [Candidatus Pacebacteria bacterium]|nr:cytochrome b [Candidatus Paceibacterota bacterium]